MKNVIPEKQRGYHGNLKFIHLYITEEIMGLIQENKYGPESNEYHSAEFRLNQPEVLYQFRIRKNISEPMFAVFKEGSKALENLKEGDIISMRYYYLDKSIPAELRDTRIKYITKDHSAGFKDHYVIGLDIHPGKNLKVA